MNARRVLITGVANWFGTQLARRLLADGRVEQVVGLDTRPPAPDLADRITFLEADVRAPDLGALLRAAAVDTVVHLDVLQFAERGRSARSLHDLNVVGTLQLLAAVDQLPSLRTVVVRGSAAIYGSEPNAPLLFTEDLARRSPLRTRFQRDMGELESMVETFARRHPQVTCTLLRFQPVVGRELDSPITRLLRRPFVVTALGFDPRIQVVHEEDAVGAIEQAVRRPVPGPVNVAAEGVVSLSRLLRRHRRPALPVAGPLMGPVAGLARRVGGPELSEDSRRYLRHGRGVDTRRLREELGFRCRYTTLEAIEASL